MYRVFTIIHTTMYVITNNTASSYVNTFTVNSTYGVQLLGMAVESNTDIIRKFQTRFCELSLMLSYYYIRYIEIFRW